MTHGAPATVRVRHQQRGGTGLLWAAAFEDRGVVGLSNAELAAGGKPAGRRIVDADARYARGLAVAANGQLWVSGDGKGTLVSFAAGQLAAAGSRTPSVAVKPPGNGRCLDGVAIASGRARDRAGREGLRDRGRAMSVALRAAVAGVVAAGLACGGGSEPKPPGGDELPDGVVTVAERQGALEALHEELASLDCSARTRSSPRRRSSGPSPGRRCSPTSSGRRSRSIR